MFQINQIINLRAENRVKIYEQALVAGNRNAHTWRVTVMDGESAATLDGCTAMLYITRADGKTVAVTGERITISGNTASAVLPEDAYAVEGAVLLEMEIFKGKDIITCAQLGAGVKKRRTDDIVLPGQGEIIDLNSLLKEIAQMREASASAREAASAANQAASEANAQAQNAGKIAGKLQGLSTTAQSLPYTSAATAGVTDDGTKYIINLGIPRGTPGAVVSATEPDDPQIGVWIDPNGGAFPLIDAADVQTREDGTRLDSELKRMNESVGQLKDDLDSKPQFGDPYEGVDLTIKYATEIADYASPWAWIKARIAAGNFSQLHVGDYIPFTTTNGRTFQAQIAGINTYKGYGDTEVGNHIDFITRELWPDAFQMNLVNFNNGTTDTKQVPWLASNGYLFVNSLAGQVPNGTTLPLDMVDKDYTAGGMYFYLPDDLKSVIVEKRVFAPSRYSASGVLTNDNNVTWVNLGKLWLPDECEVTGARLMTTTGWFSGGYVQYPIFAGNMNRLKRANGSRYNWWLSSAPAGNSANFVLAYIYGQVISTGASYAFRAPFCFRVS